MIDNLISRDDRNKIYNQALIKWGGSNQLLVAIEELAELQVEISKHLTNKRAGLYEIIDELADATIMIEQVSFMLGLDCAVAERIKFKLDKLEKVINK